MVGVEWIDGTDMWTARDDLDARFRESLAAELGEVVTVIGRVELDGGRDRRSGDRGGPLLPLLDRIYRWLEAPEWNANDLVDVDAVRRLAAQALEVVDDPVVQGFVHGDLIPGNLLVDNESLTSIIDWGGAGHGDLAQDLAPA